VRVKCSNNDGKDHMHTHTHMHIIHKSFYILTLTHTPTGKAARVACLKCGLYLCVSCDKAEHARAPANTHYRFPVGMCMYMSAYVCISLLSLLLSLCFSLFLFSLSLSHNVHPCIHTHTHTYTHTHAHTHIHVHTYRSSTVLCCNG